MWKYLAFAVLVLAYCFPYFSLYVLYPATGNLRDNLLKKQEGLPNLSCTKDGSFLQVKKEDGTYARISGIDFKKEMNITCKDIVKNSSIIELLATYFDEPDAAINVSDACQELISKVECEKYEKYFFSLLRKGKCEILYSQDKKPTDKVKKVLEDLNPTANLVKMWQFLGDTIPF